MKAKVAVIVGQRASILLRDQGQTTLFRNFISNSLFGLIGKYDISDLTQLSHTKNITFAIFGFVKERLGKVNAFFSTFEIVFVCLMYIDTNFVHWERPISLHSVWIMSFFFISIKYAKRFIAKYLHYIDENVDFSLL